MDIWFMPNNRQKFISKTILPIFAGGLVSILVHLGLLYLFIVLFPVEREYSDSVICLIAFFMPAMAGGFVTTFFFAKTKFIHSILSAIIFLIGIIVPEIGDFSLELNYSKQVDHFFLKIFLIIVIAGMSGGYIGILIRRKKRIS